MAALASALGSSETSHSDIVWPLGITQSAGISQQRQFSRIYELGSERSIWVAGRTMGSLNIARIWVDGPSMLRALYAYYQDLLPPTQVPWLFPNQAATALANPHNVRIPPGYENLYLNLGSDLFTQPIGFMLMTLNSNLQTMGVVYLENSVVPQHQWATDAQGTLVQESAGIQYERMVPVNVSAVPVITGEEETTAALAA
jgi:hypothetical protein